MDSALDMQTMRALLQWQVELGADVAVGEVPVDRYALPDRLPRPAASSPAKPAQPGPPAAGAAAGDVASDAATDPVAEATQLARAAGDLDALRAAMAAYPHCDLKRGARNLVFSDGQPGARVMIIGEGPGREEDMQGRPFIGRAGRMLDRMFAAIGLARDADTLRDALYITNVVPWRPPQNRDPSAEEIAMMRPFVQRHVELAAPDVVVLMGNISLDAALGARGITRLRGKWAEGWGKPALPMFHPAYLLRQPAMKRHAWADLLMLQARLRGDT